ncbi:MAG: hypothetical protein IKT97_08080 [Spirochaetia bacterium]|nr:hypothetical protein [Spirochaetia bacterium]
MPEDLLDKLIDFGLMLEGGAKLAMDGALSPDEKDRILSYWIDISGEIREAVNKARSKN